MSINIHFDTGSTSKEELSGLAALISHVAPVALTMSELRRHQDRMYGGTALGAKGSAYDAEGYSGVAENGAMTIADRLDITRSFSPAQEQIADAPSTQTIPTTVIARERGKAAPGRARRTKEEIAEDEAADKADAANGSGETKQSISTGGERNHPEDDEATQAADRADEVAEEKPAAPQKSITDLVMEGKAAVGVYVNKHGMEATTEDGAAVFASALGTPPAGKGWGWNMLVEAGDYSKVEAAAKAWQGATNAGGRFGA